MRLKAKSLLSSRSDFSLAIAAVNQLVIKRLKRDFGAFATFGIGNRKHMALISIYPGEPKP